MTTKKKGDVAEQAVILEGLKRGWGVLTPIGDRLPYDLVFDINIEEIGVSYVFPSDVFISYSSNIHMVEAKKRQRKPRSHEYREAWPLIAEWARCRETCNGHLSNSGKPLAR